MARREIVDIPVDRIHPRPDQPRRHFDDESLVLLAESLDADGQAVPALVRPHPKRKGHFELIGGERRWRAVRAHCKRTTHLACVVEDLDDEAAWDRSLLENENREDLTPLEKAEAVARLVAQGQRQVDVARKLGKTNSWVHQMLRLARLHPEVKALIDHNVTPERKQLAIVSAKQIARLPQKKQLALAKKAAGRGMRVRQVMQHVDELLGLRQRSPSKIAKTPTQSSERHRRVSFEAMLDDFAFRLAKTCDPFTAQRLFRGVTIEHADEAEKRIEQICGSLTAIAEALRKAKRQAVAGRIVA